MAAAPADDSDRRIWAARRNAQAVGWMRELLQERLLSAPQATNPAVAKRLTELEREVRVRKMHTIAGRDGARVWLRARLHNEDAAVTAPTARRLMSRQGARRVLITGFGPFPGVPVNATMRLVPELGQAAARAFQDVHVVTDVLATEWASAPHHLERLLAETTPDFVLHFGVSARARGFEIEARACNLRSMAPDGAGALPEGRAVHADGTEHLKATLPVAYLVSRLRQRRIPAFISRDAGAYLCNATLYYSLACARAAPRRRVGLVHVPARLARSGSGNRGRVGPCPLTWEQALEGGLEILATCLGCALPHPGKRNSAVQIS
jgi:pyroglutamyl-peptidase